MRKKQKQLISKKTTHILLRVDHLENVKKIHDTVLKHLLSTDSLPEGVDSIIVTDDVDYIPKKDYDKLLRDYRKLKRSRGKKDEAKD